MVSKLYLYGGALVFGIIGVGIALGVWHLYTDHVNHHALVNMVVASQKAQQVPALQAAPVPGK